MVCYSCLQNLYETIIDLLSEKQCNSFKSDYPNQTAWDKYVKELIDWADNLEITAENKLSNLETLKLLNGVYPSLASKIFPVLPANPFPMELLSRMSFKEYRVFCLLWFYYWTIIENQVPRETHQSVRCKNKALGFSTIILRNDCEVTKTTNKITLLLYAADAKES